MPDRTEAPAIRPLVVRNSRRELPFCCSLIREAPREHLNPFHARMGNGNVRTYGHANGASRLPRAALPTARTDNALFDGVVGALQLLRNARDFGAVHGRAGRGR